MYIDFAVRNLMRDADHERVQSDERAEIGLYIGAESGPRKERCHCLSYVIYAALPVGG